MNKEFTQADVDNISALTVKVALAQEKTAEINRDLNGIEVKIDCIIERLGHVESTLACNKAFVGGVIFAVTSVFAAITWLISNLRGT